MKSIIILYNDEDSLFCNDKVFDGKSASERCEEWAKSLDSDFVVINKCKNLSGLFSEMSNICKEKEADYVIFSFNDLPFLNVKLTKELIETHVKYKAEYTFADGYSYGFSPEIIDKGTIGILEQLSKTVQESDGLLPVKRDSIFNFIKKDINSYEIESVLADTDWRLYRFNFDCSSKENFIACKELFNLIEKDDDVEIISKKASVNPKILKTVPGFYNIQIQDSCRGKCSYCPYPEAYEEKNGISPCNSKVSMNLENFSNLLEKIKKFSNSAVISLSSWGEAFENPDILKYIEKVLSYSEFSLFIETDGMNITESFCQNLEKILHEMPVHKGKYSPLMIAVSIDGFSDETCRKVRGEEISVKDLAEKIKLLNSVIPGCVYPQFVRMNENESELEQFFRYWNEKSNESAGNLIIQKYNDFADLLPECKPADLSPLERNVCWHLRRDMTILSNGNVPLCYQYVLDGIVGNVFKEPLEEIWQKYDKELENHIIGNYCEKCRKCDEYYTFNF